MRTLPAAMLSPRGGPAAQQRFRPHALLRRAALALGWRRLRVLHPTAASYDHDVACELAQLRALRVTAHGRSVLLTGDIEARDEQAAAGTAVPLRAELCWSRTMAARTSSTPAFLDAVGPRLAIFTVGIATASAIPGPTWSRATRTAACRSCATDERRRAVGGDEACRGLQVYRHSRTLRTLLALARRGGSAALGGIECSRSRASASRRAFTARLNAPCGRTSPPRTSPVGFVCHGSTGSARSRTGARPGPSVSTTSA